MKNEFNDFTIIPSIRQLKDLDDFLQTSLPIVLLSEVHIGNLGVLAKKCKKHNKKVFVNVDLIGGFSSDKMGIKLLKTLYNVDGVMSSNIMVLSMCKSVGLFTIQRFFLMDSRAFDSSLKSLKSSQADAIELLPSPLAPKFLDRIMENKKLPILAGGFVEDLDSVEMFKKLGFSGVTTSCKEVWLKQ
ncbi:glycerol-3-phosphate responsive antiterminator [Tissierella sp. MSJ-40]|uniref:Glycerol-3-phosphate responsive antiterminator n=1 Tax=Tissierella simiarum TaxID=2841534 RepID=A0ABS6EB37_9FIRM|nr:glycerol-3-phosphate responsive antiterminator [Tissierella simiarum]MBU5440147.1 glycerol-3-phosphate responsive antiterminator [Tissierella simiarum]